MPLERQGMRDHRIDFDLAGHVPIDDFRHVGAAARTTEGCAAPYPPGDELERPRGDLRAGAGMPTTMLSPQPRWQASSAPGASRPTSPVQSKV